MTQEYMEQHDWRSGKLQQMINSEKEKKIMLITENDRKRLNDYSSDKRIWQGIPGIEVTENGRIFATFYSGGTKEEKGNFCVLVHSEDGIHFSEPIAVAAPDDELHRCYDPCIWIDPLKRLWFVWACAPNHAVYASICENPDADILCWTPVFKIGQDVMMNKPIVLSSGEWIFPLAVWGKNVATGGFASPHEPRGSFAVCSKDEGKTFEVAGYCPSMNLTFDEHMITERRDGSLMMHIRRKGTLAVSYSYDKGHTWTTPADSNIESPDSRFSIIRLKSDRLLLVNHKNFNGRNNLTAMLSEDDGKTWKYSLLLDERSNVSYPDVKEAADGYIYICYDRERGAFLDTLEEAYASAREILYAKVTENDIISGKIADGSQLKTVISNQ